MSGELRQRYRDEVVPALTKEFSYSNPMQVPRLTKIVVNVGLGEARYRPFRSLVAPICLAQSIVVALGHRLAARPGEKNGRRR